MSLISFDYKSFHVLTLGFEAGDATYMRMARLDMHSYFALVGLLRLEKSEVLRERSDQELLDLFKWWKKSDRIFPEFGGRSFQEIRDQKAKRAILGIGFGQGAHSLYMLNPESFGSNKEAQLVLDRLNGEFPLPETWRSVIKLKADTDRKLVSRHGFVRHFWDVYHRRPVGDDYIPGWGERVWEHKGTGQRWLLKPGDDAEAAIAFLPANDAFGAIRGVMVKLGEDGLDERYQLINQVHDSLVFDCPPRLEEECLVEVRARMEAPNRILTDPVVAPEGLWCKVEAKMGPNMAEMQAL